MNLGWDNDIMCQANIQAAFAYLVVQLVLYINSSENSRCVKNNITSPEVGWGEKC